MENDSSTPMPTETDAPVLSESESQILPADLEIPSVGIVFENDAWLSPLFDSLDEAGIPYQPIDVREHSFDLLDARRHTLYLNRVSPSSYLRGNDGAIAHAHALLAALEASGAKVINGSRSFHLETSKVAQQILMSGLGVDVPKTEVVSSRDAVRKVIDDLVFPLILKPDTGGSGAFVRRIENREHLLAFIDDDEVFAPGHLMLLQEIVVPADGSIARVEFVDGECLFAMRVKPQNTYNLCPAEGCPRNPIEEGIEASASFETWADVPDDAIAQAREILRVAKLDIGGVEWIDTASGRRCFIDINATSVYRQDIQKATNVNGFLKVSGYLARELAKEDAKSSHLNGRGRS
jgi:glutathione synthase/RimK-type ligase-like ATP-grasp enzyme